MCQVILSLIALAEELIPLLATQKKRGLPHHQATAMTWARCSITPQQKGVQTMIRTNVLRPVAIAAMMATFGASAAYAQTSPPAKTAPQNMANAASGQSTPASKLIGRNVQNAQNETIGEIKSIYLGKDGKVDSVMVGVGGFLGMGEREVKLAWKDLNITNNGEKVTVDMTKDQLKAQPEYKYPNTAYRGQVFDDKGVSTDNQRATAPTNRPATMVSTGDFNADGQVSANAVVGAAVKNNNKDTIGTIEDAYVDKNGAIKVVIVSVGGFLGIGDKNVAVKWSDIKFGRDGNDVVVMTDWTKDSLKAMPDYKYERRVPAKRG
jgi:sporulation protein YlmC with PRC-barrel domain